MKQISVSFARLKETLESLTIDQKELACVKSVGWTEIIQFWPNRKSLEKTLELQAKRSHLAPKINKWRPVVEIHETRETIARRAEWEQYKKDYNAGLIPTVNQSPPSRSGR